MKKLRSYIYDQFRRPDAPLLLSNFANFGFFQVLNYLVPLITIPYIVRVIGPAKFGIISLAYALSYYFNIISDYGYSISGVQKIAQNQGDTIKLSSITKNIFSIQFILMGLCFLFLIAIINIFKNLHIYQDVFFFAFLMVPANILVAIWFYLGIEKVHFINYVTLVSKILYVICIFVFIQSESDYHFVPLIYSLTLFLGGLVSLFILVRVFGISFRKNISTDLPRYLREDRALFISNVFINLYRNSNIIILKFFAGEYIVGIYSAGERIIKAIQGMFTPLTQVLYPFISRIRIHSEQRSKKAIKKLILVMGILSALVSILIFVMAPIVSDVLLGEDFRETTMILRIASFVIFFGMLNYIIGIIYMTNFGMKTSFSKSVMITGILNILFCTILSYYYQATGAALAFVLAEFMLFILLQFYIRNKKISTSSR